MFRLLRVSGALFGLAVTAWIVGLWPIGCSAPPPAGSGGAPSVCGNNIREGSEACDGTDVRQDTCDAINTAYSGGKIRCASNCTFDYSQCVPNVCGDGFFGGSESCEPSLPLETCAQLGFPLGGTVSCTSSCTYDTSGCRRAVCGDGKIEAPEQCEGANMGAYAGKTCSEINSVYTSGTPVCNLFCMLDTTPCAPHACGVTRFGISCY